MIHFALTNLTNSSKLILKVVVSNGRTTQKDLLENTALAPRTIRYALSRLKELGLLKEAVSLDDTRKRIYWLNEERRDLCPGYT